MCSRRIRPSRLVSPILVVCWGCPLTFDMTTSSLGDDWLCCSSDKGTVHVFALQDYTLNKRSALSTLGVPGAYAGTWHSGPLSLLCKGLFRVKSSGSPIRELHLNLDDCSAFSTFLGIVQYNFWWERKSEHNGIRTRCIHRGCTIVRHCSRNINSVTWINYALVFWH